MRANISARFPTVATDWYEKYRAGATTSTASTRSRYLRDKATTEPELKVLRRELGFFRKHRMRYASLKVNGCGSGVVRQQSPGQPSA